MGDGGWIVDSFMIYLRDWNRWRRGLMRLAEVGLWRDSWLCCHMSKRCCLLFASVVFRSYCGS